MSLPNPYRAAGTFGGEAYVVRDADRRLLKEIRDNQRYPYACAPRQSGKSSWIARTVTRLDADVFRCAMVDLSPLKITDATMLMAQVLRLIAKDARLDASAIDADHPDDTFRAWLGALPQRLIVFIDEIDRLLGTEDPDIKEQFLSMIRSLFNRRAVEAPFVRLQFVLAGAAPAGRLIEHPDRSPFNVGVEIELPALNREEVGELAKHLTDHVPVAAGVVDRIHQVTGGLVYLCQLILESLWSRAEEREGSSVTLADLEEVVARIILEAPQNIHFTNIHRMVAEVPEVHAHFLRSLAGHALSPRALVDLMITGISSREATFRSEIYVRVFGAGGPLDLTDVQQPGLRYETRWYVGSDEDRQALDALLAGEPVLIHGPDRSGKSTVLGHVLERLTALRPSAPVARVELGAKQGAELNGEGLVALFAGVTAQSLAPITVGLPRASGRLHWTVALTRWMQEAALPRVPAGERLVLAVEDLHALQNPTLRGDLDGMLERWSEDERLHILLTSAATSAPLIARWIPHPIELRDFHAGQAEELAHIHQLRWTRREIQEVLMPHIGGQPYLLRVAMYDARRRIRSLDDVARDARDAGGAFERHLTSLFQSINDDWPLVEALKRALRSTQSVTDDRTREKLTVAGIVEPTDEGGYRIRYKIYETYLRRRWASV